MGIPCPLIKHRPNDHFIPCLVHLIRATDSVLSSPRILNVPLLLLANKQDTPTSMSATEIRQDYEVWDHHRRDSARRRYAEEEAEEEERKKSRIASLEVMGVSALEGYVYIAVHCLWSVERMGCRQGVREAVDWLFLRVQNSRQ